MNEDESLTTLDISRQRIKSSRGTIIDDEFPDLEILKHSLLFRKISLTTKLVLKSVFIKFG